MPLNIVEIHASSSSKQLNTEWFVLTNETDKPFSSRNCKLAISRGASKRKTEIGTLDPGFTMAPGESVRVVTGSAGKKAQGKPPSDDTKNYHLFLNAPILKGKGTVLTFSLRSMELASAAYDPDEKSGVAPETTND